MFYLCTPQRACLSVLGLAASERQLSPSPSPHFEPVDRQICGLASLDSGLLSVLIETDTPATLMSLVMRKAGMHGFLTRDNARELAGRAKCPSILATGQPPLAAGVCASLIPYPPCCVSASLFGSIAGAARRSRL